MKKAQYNKLSKFEESFKQAKAGYYRAIMRADLEEMAVIYRELGYEIDQINCNRCILGMLQNLGKEFENYKTKHTKENDTQH